MKPVKRLVIAMGLLLACALPQAASALPPVKHVWIIVLENKDFDQSFGTNSVAPYLAKTLTGEGQLLENYYGTSHLSLGNYITLASGQAPNPITQADCPTGFNDIFPGVVSPDHDQVVGSGCVFPKEAKTIGNQFQDKGLSWKGYMQDMGTPCRHPAIGEMDPTQSARVGDQYAVRHNPFMYFHSIIDDDANCKKHVVDLKELATDLQSAATTPAFNFITPSLCDDGHDAPCVDGRPGGLESADLFLKTWAPRILESPAFYEGGMLVVTWDEGNAGPENAGSCCGQPAGLNTPLPGIFGPGGGRTGTVIISPWTRPGSRNTQPYNHYGLLRTVQNLFGLGPLGYSGLEGLKAMDADVFNQERAPVCTSSVKRVGRKLQIKVGAPQYVRVRVRSGAKVQTRKAAACLSYRVSLPKRGHGTARVTLDGKKQRFRY